MQQKRLQDGNTVIQKGQKQMATNPPTSDNHRNGQVTHRSQVHNPKIDRWVERNTENGKFINQKHDDKPFKGVRKEK